MQASVSPPREADGGQGVLTWHSHAFYYPAGVLHCSRRLEGEQ